MRLSAVTKLISAIVFASATALFTIGAFVWVLFYVSNMEDSFTIIESKISVLEDNRSAAKRATRTFQQEEQTVHRINKFFVDPKNPVSFIEELESLAVDTRNKISLNIDEQKNTPDSLTFHLTLDGDTESIIRYLTLLELLPYEIIVSDIGYQEQDSAPASSQKKDASAAPPRSARLIIEIRVKKAAV